MIMTRMGDELSDGDFVVCYSPTAERPQAPPAAHVSPAPSHVASSPNRQVPDSLLTRGLREVSRTIATNLQTSLQTASATAQRHYQLSPAKNGGRQSGEPGMYVTNGGEYDGVANGGGDLAGQGYSVHMDGPLNKFIFSVDEDVAFAQQSVPQYQVQWRVVHLRLLLLGKAGVGKSTLLHTLLLAYAGGNPPCVNASGGATWEQLLENDAQFEVTLQVRDHEHHVEYDIRAVDSPPLPPSVLADPTSAVNYLQTLHHNHLKQIADLTPSAQHTPVTEPRDKRFDACLLLMPHHTPEASPYLPLIRALSPHVAVIPILSKSDSLTQAEVRNFREKFAEQLRSVPSLFRFSDSARAAVGVKRVLPPFTTIASTLVAPDTPLWPIRQYAWGTSEAFRERDSDVIYLKKLLFEVGLPELQAHTERLYRTCCAASLAVEIKSKPPGGTRADAASKPADRRPKPPPFLASYPTTAVVPGAATSAGQGERKKYYEATVKELKEYGRDGGHVGNSYRLILEVAAARKLVTLRIGVSEGAQLSLAISGHPPGRPSTYDLWKGSLEAFGLFVQKVLVEDLQETIFYSRVLIASPGGGEVKCIDARPSDAVNLAVRFKAPIMVSSAVVAQVGKHV